MTDLDQIKGHTTDKIRDQASRDQGVCPPPKSPSRVCPVRVSVSTRGVARVQHISECVQPVPVLARCVSSTYQCAYECVQDADTRQDPGPGVARPGGLPPPKSCPRVCPVRVSVSMRVSSPFQRFRGVCPARAVYPGRRGVCVLCPACACMRTVCVQHVHGCVQDADDRQDLGPGVARPGGLPPRFRAKMEQLKTFEGLLCERQGHNLALTVLFVPCSLDRCPPVTKGATSQTPESTFTSF